MVGALMLALGLALAVLATVMIASRLKDPPPAPMARPVSAPFPVVALAQALPDAPVSRPPLCVACVACIPASVWAALDPSVQASLVETGGPWTETEGAWQSVPCDADRWESLSTALQVADVRGWWISAAPMSTARVSGVRPRAPVPLATPHRAARAARGGRR